ncbi:MAG: GTPase domain-containing protein [Tepidisphaeraceae bacterium]
MQNRAQVLAQLQQIVHSISSIASPAADRVSSDLQATAFHLSRQPTDHPIVAIIGGTGTGKSSLVNRLLGAEVTATSFRRTWTAGPVAITKDGLPPRFLALPHLPPDENPPRGQADRVVVVHVDHPLLASIHLVDTPDIDGVVTDHHTIADRIFRWADAVIFLVTPEKYQMTELQPYYRLAHRYAVPACYVMNKADEQAVVDDYQSLLHRSGVDSPRIYAIPRDDATWQPAPDQVLKPESLQFKIAAPQQAIRYRLFDATARLNDQLLQPLLDLRQQIDRATEQMSSFLGDAIDVDVHPLTQQLQRRMRERSVLYLIGPQRIIDRVRTMPATLARLPRSMWDWTRTGDFKLPAVEASRRGEPPDFRNVVVEQFQALQSRLEDLIRQSPALAAQSGDWKLDIEAAGAIVDEEIGMLRQWLETRWNATPRDTAILQKLLKVIPGGKQLTKYSEAAPYLLAVACVAKGAVFGHLDLISLGGYSAVTWLSEKINDEVASRTRATNRAITDRYQKLAAQQIERAIAWLAQLAPPRRTLTQIAEHIEAIRSGI